MIRLPPAKPGPQLFRLEVVAAPRPCPFASENYQLMRNVAFAHEWARLRDLPWFGFLVCVVRGAPHTGRLLTRVAAFRAILQPDFADRVGLLDYQRVASILHDHGEKELAAWVRSRLIKVLGGSAADTA